VVSAWMTADPYTTFSSWAFRGVEAVMARNPLDAIAHKCKAQSGNGFPSLTFVPIPQVRRRSLASHIIVHFFIELHRFMGFKPGLAHLTGRHEIGFH
jgi:hypothetical protein